MNASFPRNVRVRTGAEYARVFELSRRTSDPVSYTHLDVYKRQVNSLAKAIATCRGRANERVRRFDSKSLICRP